MKIENWFLGLQGSPYQAPELQTQVLCGEVYGHPRHKDGNKVTTSRVMKKYRGFVETKNSLYELGKIDPEYLNAHPNAIDILGGHQ